MRIANLLILPAVLLAALGCGKSPLEKAHAEYDRQVEPLLLRENEQWKRLATLFNEQSNDETANPERFADVLRNEAIPFYDGLAKSVSAVPVGDPGLAAAHDLLQKFVKARTDFAHLLSDNLELIRIGDPTRALSQKDAALETAFGRYGAKLQEKGAEPEGRFSELVVAQTDFQNSCLTPMAEGRMNAADVRERIASRILPKVKAVRATKFADDEASQLLRLAAAAEEEFFLAVIENLPRMEASARLKRGSETLAKDGDELAKKFIAEMAAVRRRMRM